MRSEVGWRCGRLGLESYCLQKSTRNIISWLQQYLCSAMRTTCVSWRSTVSTIPSSGIYRRRSIGSWARAHSRLAPSWNASKQRLPTTATWAHCVGVSSGTAALSLMFRAHGIGPGDEVIVPGHTFIASALAVAHVGATPVLCDVDEGTGLIDPDAARAAVGPRTAAVLAVHLYGQACDMAAIEAFAKPQGLLVFEDAAQAHGARYRGAAGRIAWRGIRILVLPHQEPGRLRRRRRCLH